MVKVNPCTFPAGGGSKKGLETKNDVTFDDGGLYRVKSALAGHTKKTQQFHFFYSPNETERNSRTLRFNDMKLFTGL